MELKALLFDVDGTLADTEADGHLPAYNRAFRDFDLSWRWSRKLYRKLLNVPSGRERIAHYIDHYKPDLGKHDADAQADPTGWVKSIHERKSHVFRERLKTGRVPLRPGVERLITQAYAAGVQIVIVTNASSATLQPFLEYALGNDLRNCITAVVSGEQIQRRKPAPDIYLEACRVIDCQPGECVAIEDSAMGLEAAHAAGVPAVVTINADTHEQALTHAQLVVDSLGGPEQPVRVLKSPGFDFDYVDLAVLRRLNRVARPAHTLAASGGAQQ